MRRSGPGSRAVPLAEQRPSGDAVSGGRRRPTKVSAATVAGYVLVSLEVPASLSWQPPPSASAECWRPYAAAVQICPAVTGIGSDTTWTVTAVPTDWLSSSHLDPSTGPQPVAVSVLTFASAVGVAGVDDFRPERRRRAGAGRVRRMGWRGRCPGHGVGPAEDELDRALLEDLHDVARDRNVSGEGGHVDELAAADVDGDRDAPRSPATVPVRSLAPSVGLPSVGGEVGHRFLPVGLAGYRSPASGFVERVPTVMAPPSAWMGRTEFVGDVGFGDRRRGR
jgi:hypothetical protein